MALTISLPIVHNADIKVNIERDGHSVPDQFSRTSLLFGQENIERLKNRRVAVFGLGGVGGHCAEALCRTGIGAIDLIDGDIVDITNINRQVIATHKTVGLAKVAVMRERLLDINPEAVITAHKVFYLPDTADSIDLSCFDYIVDAVDTVTAKLELICCAARLGVPVISSMGAANKLDPTAFEVADIYETSVCPMARVMRSELRKRGVGSLKVVYSREKPAVIYTESGIQNAERRKLIPGSNAFVPATAGLIIASEVIKGLITT